MVIFSEITEEEYIEERHSSPESENVTNTSCVITWKSAR